MSKVTVVGAGNVGATCANVLVTTGVADEVVLIDIKEGLRLDCRRSHSFYMNHLHFRAKCKSVVANLLYGTILVCKNESLSLPLVSSAQYGHLIVRLQ